MELQQLQNDWRNANDTAKSAYKEHQAAIQRYKEKQEAKNWFPDYDLLAQTNGALNKLQSAYNEMHQLAALLYNEVVTLQQSNKNDQQEPLRTVTGYCSIKEAIWLFFLEKGLSKFADDSCPAEHRRAIIAKMEKDVESFPSLQKAIDFLNARQ